MKSYSIRTKLWKYNGPAAWYFLTISKTKAIEMKLKEKRRNGWGQVKVQVLIGNTRFSTSLFPDKNGSYVLPVKAQVRKKESLIEGKLVKAELTTIR